MKIFFDIFSIQTEVLDKFNFVINYEYTIKLMTYDKLTVKNFSLSGKSIKKIALFYEIILKKKK